MVVRPARLPVPQASAAAAAASEAAVGATAGFAKTKAVPLVDSIVGQSLPVAFARSAALLVACFVGVTVGRWALAEMDKRLCDMMDRNKRAKGLHLVVGTALVAAHRPASALLPLYGTSYSLTILSALVEVAVAKAGLGCHPKLRFCGTHVVRLLKAVTQGFEAISELVIILAGSWFLVRWKDRLVTRILERTRRVRDPQDDQLERLLLPLSRLLTWLIVGFAGVAGLGAVGLDIRPLLALGSVSSLVAGLAAQTTLSNLVSALSLYTSRPFVAGDRVQLKQGSTTIVAGVVEKIQPLRTVIRTDDRYPVYLNNKDVATMLILNESQQRRKVAVSPPMALLDEKVMVRYQDIKRVPLLEEAITDYLAQHPDIDQALSYSCVMAGFTDTGIALQVKASLTKPASSRASKVRSAILLDVDRVIRSTGAHLAIAGADTVDGTAGAQEAAGSDAGAQQEAAAAGVNSSERPGTS